MFGKKKTASVEPVNRDRVIALMKTGMDRSAAIDRDVDDATWQPIEAADRQAWANATPAERRAAADALRRHGYT